MNKQRRKEIKQVIDRLEEIRGEVGFLLDTVQGIMDEETEYRDNIPENMQGGDRFEMADNACNELESAHDTLDQVDNGLSEVISSLESAAE